MVAMNSYQLVTAVFQWSHRLLDGGVWFRCV